jgi:hypothetical protein
MFHDQNRIPGIMKLFQNTHEPLRVARVQTDARLIKDDSVFTSPEPAQVETHLFGFASGSERVGRSSVR